MSIWGTGADGNVTISTDTTLTSNKNYTDLTINSGITLTTAGYTIYVSGTLLNNGTIKGGYIGTPGTGGAQVAPTTSTGVNGNVGSSGSGGAGDGGDSGASGGTAHFDHPYYGEDWAYGGYGGAGGDGGRASNDIIIYVYYLDNRGTITARGESGEDGSDGADGEQDKASGTYDIIGGGGGGGEGGQGGDSGDINITNYSILTNGTITCSGGASGGGTEGGLGGYAETMYAGFTTGYNGGSSDRGGDGGNACNGYPGVINYTATPGGPGMYGYGGEAGTFTLTKYGEDPNYGLKLKDTVNIHTVTPDVATIISCGTITMPNSLNGDGTYGYDIDLPGVDPIPVSKIGVILLPHGNIHWTAEVLYGSWNDSDNHKNYLSNAWLDDYYSYYTKNDTTGVMTSFTVGSKTSGTMSTYDAMISVFPLYGWDRTADTITSVRLWATTCYIILDGMTDFKAVYSIGNTGGIETVDYVIFLKEWDY